MVHKRIYLHLELDVDQGDHRAPEFTWSEDLIEDTDIAYVLEDVGIPSVCPRCGAAIDQAASYGTVLVAKSRKEQSK